MNSVDSVFVYEHPEHPEIHKMDWQFFIKVSREIIINNNNNNHHHPHPHHH